MINPQDYESNDLAGLFDEESSDDLGSLFNEEAPQGVSAQANELDSLFADSEDGLDSLFADAPVLTPEVESSQELLSLEDSGFGDLADLFDEPLEIPAPKDSADDAQSQNNDLGDLFSDEGAVGVSEASADLSDLFGDNESGSELPAETSENISDLSDLFSDEPILVAKDSKEVSSNDAPAEKGVEAKEGKEQESQSTEPVPEVRRKRPAPVFGELSRPTRTLELKGKPVVARSASKRLADEKLAESKKAEIEAAKIKAAEVEITEPPAVPVASAEVQEIESTAVETLSNEVNTVSPTSSEILNLEALKIEVSSPSAPALKNEKEDEESVLVSEPEIDPIDQTQDLEIIKTLKVEEVLETASLATNLEIKKTPEESVQAPEPAAEIEPEPLVEPSAPEGTSDSKGSQKDAELASEIKVTSELPNISLPELKAAEPAPKPAVEAIKSAEITIETSVTKESDPVSTTIPSAFQSAAPEAPVESPAEAREREQRMRAYAEMEQQTRRYMQTAHFWDVVDRIRSALSTEPSIQGIIKGFVLTRDKRIDAAQAQLLRDKLSPLLSSRGIAMGNPKDSAFVFEMLYDEVIGISVLGPLWRDDNVTEILVDSWDSVSVESNGVLLSTQIKFQSSDHANSVARSLAERISDRAVSKSNPLVTAELPRARIQFAYGPVVKGGLSLTIRKFQPLLTFEKLLSFGSLNTDMARFLKLCVQGKANILVSGGTGTGKTTIINLLSGFIPDNERVVTIEDAFELDLLNRHWVALQTKEKASADDEVSVKLEDLLRSTLRMRPDRIVVGEIRETAGAEVMVMAANTGHEGTMTTIHANSGESAVNRRLPVLLRNGSSDEVARETVASAFQLVVQISRAKGRRFISEISVIDPSAYVAGHITPEPVFLGKVDSNGQVFFRRDKPLRPGTDLYNKLVDEGLDISEWEN